MLLTQIPTVMISKLLVVVFTFIQNQDQLAAIEEMARQKKVNNMSQLITLLSIFSLVVVILLIINLVKNYKLKAEISRLKIQ